LRSCLALAHQRFLQNKGLVFVIIASLLATFIEELLHAWVPGFLVSITDSIDALIVLIPAIILGLVMLISSVISVGKAVT